MGNARHIYLVEGYNISDKTRKAQVKQSLVGTEVRDKFLIVEVKNLVEVTRVLLQWTYMIYQQIESQSKTTSVHSNFFEDVGCRLFDDLNSSMDAKKSVTSHKILFGRQLMAVDGATDLVAYNIISRY